jgi:hypothetical protein
MNKDSSIGSESSEVRFRTIFYITFQYEKHLSIFFQNEKGKNLIAYRWKISMNSI